MTTYFTTKQTKELEDAVNNITRSTKDSSQTIGNSMKEIMTKYSHRNPPIKVKYKNWKDEIGIRTIIPLSVQYGNNEFYKNNQWLMDVWDMDKDAERTYAMQDIIEFIKDE